MVHKEQLQTN